MSTALENFLARLYSSPLETESFLRDRGAYARAVGLPAEHLPDALAIDTATLRFAARGFDEKRRPRSEGVSPGTSSLRGRR
jgi:hypothetical protein